LSEKVIPWGKCPLLMHAWGFGVMESILNRLFLQLYGVYHLLDTLLLSSTKEARRRHKVVFIPPL